MIKKSTKSGISWYPNHSKWLARIYIDKKEKFIGYFNTEKEAIEARYKAEERYKVTIESLEAKKWVELNIYENDIKYFISNMGRLKRLKSKSEKIIGECIGNAGYKIVEVGGVKTTIHQLVAMAFLDHIPDGTNTLVVDHIDGDKLNNKLDNLQIVTNRINTTKGNRTGNSSLHIGVCHDRLKNRWRADIVACGRKVYLGSYVKTNENEEKLSKMYNKALNKLLENEDFYRENINHLSVKERREYLLSYNNRKI